MSEFGIEMRRLRMRREMSLAALAERVHYDKGYLSKIETGRLPANRRLASLVDVELGADGELIALVPEEPRRRGGSGAAAGPDGEPEWGRELVAFGETLSVPLGLRPTAGRGDGDDLRLLAHYREEFERHRRLSQQLPPELVLRRLIVDFNTLMELERISRSAASRPRLRLLAARYAEFIGWMCQEAGRLDLALAWTRRTADLATRAEAADLAAYTLVREAELALYDGDPATAMELAERVLRDPRARARSRGLAAHRQAQAFAVRGDHARCLSSLDYARELLHPERVAQEARSGDEPVVGSATVGGLDNAIAGWCHYDLGRPQRASEFLADALERTPEGAHRSRALFGARLALAYEASGELEEMQAVTLRVLQDAGLVRSAGADAELRGLSRALMRHHNIRALRELRNSLDEALVGAR